MLWILKKLEKFMLFYLGGNALRMDSAWVRGALITLALDSMSPTVALTTPTVTTVYTATAKLWLANHCSSQIRYAIQLSNARWDWLALRTQLKTQNYAWIYLKAQMELWLMIANYARVESLKSLIKLARVHQQLGNSRKRFTILTFAQLAGNFAPSKIPKA